MDLSVAQAPWKLHARCRRSRPPMSRRRPCALRADKAATIRAAGPQRSRGTVQLQHQTMASTPEASCTNRISTFPVDCAARRLPSGAPAPPLPALVVRSAPSSVTSSQYLRADVDAVPAAVVSRAGSNPGDLIAKLNRDIFTKCLQPVVHHTPMAYQVKSVFGTARMPPEPSSLPSRPVMKSSGSAVTPPCS